MGSWMEAGHQKDQITIRSLALSALTLHVPEREKGLEMELTNQHAYIMKLP